jgi:hypothetical protein
MNQFHRGLFRLEFREIERAFGLGVKLRFAVRRAGFRAPPCCQCPRKVGRSLLYFTERTSVAIPVTCSVLAPGCKQGTRRRGCYCLSQSLASFKVTLLFANHPVKL